MARVSAQELQETITDTLDRVDRDHERVIVHNQGRDVAAVVPMEDLRAWEEMEDRLDLEAHGRSIKESEGKPNIRAEDLFQELGL
jgi:prevent-host-death family protein